MKISIITVTYNNAQGLLTTLESIKRMPRKFYELVVIDGGSVDETLSIAEMYSKCIDVLISEEDKGIYDAMNKGINCSTGEYMIFMNSGDRFSEEFDLSNCIDILKREDPMIMYGDVKLCKSNEVVGYKYQPSNLNKIFMYSNNLCHQSVFFNRTILNSNNKYSLEFPILADYEFMVRNIILNNVKTVHMPEFICDYDITGISSRRSFFKLILTRGRIVKETLNLVEWVNFVVINLMYKPLSKLRRCQS